MLEILENSGLDKTESKVYLSLLELGPSSVSEITRKAGITRTLGYHILEKLGWYNLVDRASGKGSKIHYIARHPNNLIYFTKNKKQLWDRRVKDTVEDLPKLLSLYKVSDKPIIRYQEGIDGAKQIYEETLESKSEILSVLDLEAWYNPKFNLYKWGKWYTKERSKRKINERVLVLDTPEGRDWMTNYLGSYTYTHYRWIKPEQVPSIKDLGGEMNIYENKVMMALFNKNPIGIMIESSVLANILKAMFELAWQVGVPAHKKKVSRRTK